MFTSSEQMLQYPPRPLVMEKRWKSNAERAPNCPRCASSNTKFCYYNNYSLSQPRYFCKGCRRYWTKGGSLRNVPVGGGCRRNRRGKSAKVQPTTDHISVITSSCNMPGPGEPHPNDPTGSFFSPDGHSSTAQPGQTDGSDIDLAVVFAKFLNQNSGLDTQLVSPELPNEANASLDIPNSTVNSDFVQENIMIEYQTPSDLIGEAELLEGFPQEFVREKQEGEENREFMENDPNSFGLRTLLNDQVVQEALWSDDASTALQNFTWQPMAQFQDNLQGFSTINPVSDNWSSFDMSGFDVFLRP
ncbi:hypothetical protein L1049_025493 [Liquidambar formosana]|uniref:Dof zinc finger protein n=1 Tax=Liquidambar formosana TaxID=63359 RepID=A0AAP0NBD1_LIQFO